MIISFTTSWGKAIPILKLRLAQKKNIALWSGKFLDMEDDESVIRKVYFGAKKTSSLLVAIKDYIYFYHNQFFFSVRFFYWIYFFIISVIIVKYIAKTVEIR